MMGFLDFARDEFGITPSLGWRVGARVAFEGLQPKDLTGDEREAAREIFGDVETIDPRARRNLCFLFGRLSGKTMWSAAYALYQLVTADISTCGPGDLPSAVIIAPSKKLAGLCVRAGWELAQRSPRLRKRVERTSDGFTLKRRDGRLVAFEAFAASKGGASARGKTILILILDEAMFFMSDDNGAFAVTDRDVYSGASPRARIVLFISTFWPTPTLMSELIEKNRAAPTTALVAIASTLRMRDDDPSIALVIEAERERDPANAAREFDSDMSAGAGSSVFFDSIALGSSVDLTRPLSMIARPGSRVEAGIDLSATRDPSTGVAFEEVDGEIALLDLLERRPKPGQPLKLSESIKAFAAMFRAHGLTSFYADGWAREAAREYATLEGFRVDSAPENRNGKALMFLALQKVVNEQRLVLPNHPRLLAQLRSVTSRPGPAGGLIINSPRRAGSHGDLVSACALAVWALADRPVARFRAPAPRWLPADGAGFEGIGTPSTYVSPDTLRAQTTPRTAAQIEADILRGDAMASASPRDFLEPGYPIVGYGPHDPLDGF